MKKSIEERFWEKVGMGDAGECWEWNAALDTVGYGIFRVGKKNKIAHRMAYELVVGVIPSGMCVLHTCDNRECVNPNHLFIGTHKDNMVDMASKGRQRGPLGEKHHNAKFNDSDVLKIRNVFSLGLATRKELREHYGTSKTAINAIIRNDTWKHL